MIDNGECPQAGEKDRRCSAHSDVANHHQVATTFSLRAPSGETRFQFISQSQGIKQGEKTLIPDGPVNIYHIWVAMHGSSVKPARTTTQVKIGGQAPKRFARVSDDANLAWPDSFTVQEAECARKMITERGVWLEERGTRAHQQHRFFCRAFATGTEWK